jgi:hypothetical protein
MGRGPVGAERVGCMGRRSPGRSGGRGAPTPGAPCGRGRWKIGWPGTGLPGAGRMVPTGGPEGGTGAGGRGGGALYTGRGPVCGTIMRGAGVAGALPMPGVAGRGGMAAGGAGAVGAGDAMTDGDAGAAAVTAAGAETGGATGRGGAAGGGEAMGGGGAGRSTTGCTGAGRTGIAGAAGAVTGGGGGATGATGFGAGGATTGLATTGGGGTGRTGGGGGTAAASFFWVMALSTSPGREMCDRSILVLISSSPRELRGERADELCASDEPRMWIRTFSASCSSRELECVFFSVTPTRGRVSRMALLLTSSSLARSLIRTLLIRPFFSALGLMSSSRPHGVSFLDSHNIEDRCACHSYSVVS